MTQVPQTPMGGSDDSLDGLRQNQGYQDDIDTSTRDQFANEAGTDPSDDVAATKAEFRQGLRDSQTDVTTDGEDDAEPPLASSDDYREDIEGRDQDDPSLGGDNKARDSAGW